MATVTEAGLPHVTPVGSLILEEGRRGYYFEEFSRNMSRNLLQNPRVCALIVNSGYRFWLRALVSGRFDAPAGIRLRGTVGFRRKATPREMKQFRSMIRPLRMLRGSRLTWSKMQHVREIHFDAYELIETGALRQMHFDDFKDRNLSPFR